MNLLTNASKYISSTFSKDNLSVARAIGREAAYGGIVGAGTGLAIGTSTDGNIKAEALIGGISGILMGAYSGRAVNKVKQELNRRMSGIESALGARTTNSYFQSGV